jgi:uncharacterized protein (DUF362 family)
MVRFDSVKVGRVISGRGLSRMLKSVLPESDIYFVKPNWYSPLRGGYTDANALETILSALPGKAIIVEGYSNDRQDGSTTYRAGDEKIDWMWLIKHPDLDWLTEENLENMRRQDRWFRDSHGITDVLNRHGAEYLSVTEELLAGRVEDPAEVKKRVESKYPAVEHDRLYSYMPSRLAKHAGASLISFAHVKGARGNYPSLTLKNMFGLIPDPLRSWWHGLKDVRLSRSIVDIAKVYAAYFPLVGVCEALSCYTVTDPDGDVKAPWGAYRIEDGGGFVACGAKLVEVDAVVSGLIRVDPEKVGYTGPAREAFGAYNRAAVASAVKAGVKWFPRV